MTVPVPRQEAKAVPTFADLEREGVKVAGGVGKQIEEDLGVSTHGGTHDQALAHPLKVEPFPDNSVKPEDFVSHPPATTPANAHPEAFAEDIASAGAGGLSLSGTGAGAAIAGHVAAESVGLHLDEALKQDLAGRAHTGAAAHLVTAGQVNPQLHEALADARDALAHDRKAQVHSAAQATPHYGEHAPHPEEEIQQQLDQQQAEAQ